MDSTDGIETNSDLRRHPATAAPDEGHHCTTGPQLNRTLSSSSSSSSSPSSSSGSASENGFEFSANETIDTPKLDEENGLTALKSGSNLMLPNIGHGNMSIGGNGSKAIPAITSDDAHISLPDNKLDNPLSSSSYPKITARETEDSSIVRESHDEGIRVSFKPMHERDGLLSSSSSSLSSSSPPSKDSVQHDATETADIPLGSTDFPTLEEENGSTALKSESSQRLLNTGHRNVSTGSGYSRALLATTCSEALLLIPNKKLDSLSPSRSYPQIIAKQTEDSFIMTKSHDEDTNVSSKPMHEKDSSLSSSSLSVSSSSKDSFQCGQTETAYIPSGPFHAPTLEKNGSTDLKSESNQTFSNTGYGNLSIASSDTRAVPATTSNDINLSTMDKKLDNSVSASSSHASNRHPKITSQITVRGTEDSRLPPESYDENIQVSSKTVHEYGRSLSSSSPSLSSSSESSSKDPFQLGAHATADTHLGSTGSPTLDKDNGSTTLKSESNQTFPNIDHANARTSSNYSSAISTVTYNEADLPIPYKNSDNSFSPPLSPAECLPKGVFPANVIELEDFQIMSESRDRKTRVSSKPIHEQRGHEIVVFPSKPAVQQGQNSSNSTTQFPPTQVMERPNDPSSSAYKIPSYVFARTKSTAPMEWSTASNESLFSIPGNMSFNRDQLFWLGKSGELGMSGPLADLSTNQSPTNGKASHSVHNSSSLDDDFRAAEAKAAETMREVIRESAENRAKEDAYPSKDKHASSKISRQEDAYPSKDKHVSSKISRQPDEKTKSFAFPVLTGDGDKGSSSKGGGMKQGQQSRIGMPKATLIAADPPRANRTAGLNKWFSHYSCFTCCRPSCF